MERIFRINPDHFQFYLEAEDADPDFESLWDQRKIAEALAAGYGIIAVRTARYDGETEVALELADSRPADSLDEWDKVMECSIQVESGAVLLSAPEDGLYEETRTPVPPGIYRALVYYGNLDLAPDGGAELEGRDYYRIVLWPGPPIPLRTIK